MDTLITSKITKPAKNKGFDIKLHPQGNSYDYFLWMCKLQKWLRDEHKIHIVLIPTITGYWTFKIIDVQLDPENPIERPPYKDVDANDYHTYEEALEAGLQAALKLIE
jgi:hypothetical protein